MPERGDQVFCDFLSLVGVLYAENLKKDILQWMLAM